MQSPVAPYRWLAAIGAVAGLAAWVYDYDFFLNAGGSAAPMSTAILTASHLRDANVLVIVFWPLAVMMAIGVGVGSVAKLLIGRYLTYLAVERKVSASTQNQALSALLLFLYRQVLRLDPGVVDHVPHVRSPMRVPVVLSVDEVRAVVDQLTGIPRIVVALLYGAGLRLLECLELRIKDLDFGRNQIVVRRGKGQKDRRTMLPDSVKARLTAHLEKVRRQQTHQRVIRFSCGLPTVVGCDGSHIPANAAANELQRPTVRAVLTSALSEDYSRRLVKS